METQEQINRVAHHQALLVIALSHQTTHRKEGLQGTSEGAEVATIAEVVQVDSTVVASSNQPQVTSQLAIRTRPWLCRVTITLVTAAV